MNFDNQQDHLNPPDMLDYHQQYHSTSEPVSPSTISSPNGSVSMALEFEGANNNHHDPLMSCKNENCEVCENQIKSGDEPDDSDAETDTTRMLLADNSLLKLTQHLDKSLSGSDSSLSSFTNLCSTCSDVVEPMKPEEVRWFYKYENDKKWTPFLGYDSLRIENQYRFVKQMPPDKNHGEGEDLSIGDDTKLEKIHVRGGLYQVEIEVRKCTSIYWKGEQFSLLRGTWFHDGSWQPLDEPSAEQIEDSHMTTFGGQKCSDFINNTPTKGTKPVILNLQLANFHVDWHSPREVFLYSEATSHKIMRSFISRFGFQKSGYRLHRGYSEEATLDDKPTDITHLVFVIHGIGQKGETNKIIRNCSKLRDCAGYLKKKYFGALQNSSERSEFFPVEWRSTLSLDGDTVESVTPNKIRGLRELLNRTAMDIMYYTSPLYRTEIVNCLTNELNRLYTMFSEKNPSFETAGGKVSVVAHSLGCVIIYDILTGFNPVQLYLKDLVPKMNENEEQGSGNSVVQDELERTRRRVLELEAAVSDQAAVVPKTTTLKFNVENFFCLGSPLAVFLALRGIRPNDGSVKTIVPSSVVKRMFNIYHPSDPVAYRLEPLVKKRYVNYLPLQIHYYAAIEKVDYESMPLEALSPSQEEAKDKIHSKETTEEPKSPEKMAKAGESRWSLMWSGWRKRGSPTPLEQELQAVMASEAKDKLAFDSLSSAEQKDECCEQTTELEFRLDYVLREGNLDSSGYLAAFTAHTSYWSSYDVGYFLLHYLHPGMDN